MRIPSPIPEIMAQYEDAQKKIDGTKGKGNVNDILKLIYIKMEAIIPEFANLQPRQKRPRLIRWYHEVAENKYGIARKVKYIPPGQRPEQWPEHYS